MGLLSNPLRSREQRLPQYQNLQSQSPTKERYSDDEFDYSDEESDGSYRSGSSSPYSSRNVSDSTPTGALLLPKRKLLQHPPRNNKFSRLYPYRLPTKVTRWVLIGVVVTIVLMVFSLVRASQAENWAVANGKVKTTTRPPPLWEKFPFLERYYGGIRTLKPFNESQPSYPVTNDPVGLSSTQDESQDQNDARNSLEKKLPPSLSWESYPTAKKESGIQECFIDVTGQVRVPPLRYYNGRTYGFPEHVSGSYEVLKLPEEICFDRYGRYGPYGFGYSQRMGGLSTGEHGENEGFGSVWEKTPRVDYRSVDWADVQRRCYSANVGRYKALPPMTPSSHGFYIGQAEPESILAGRSPGNGTVNAEKETSDDHPKKPAATPTFTKSTKGGVSTGTTARTAVVVRCWDSFLFREDDVANIRSMIAELSMASGGRYDVHLLVQVKEDGKHPIWADHEAYQKRINETIPKEFQGLVTLWTETQMLALYQGMFDLWTRGPDLPVHGVYRGLSMAMQHFAYLHPEYDYFWQWEMDIRYTGHYYDFVTKLEEWAKAQPRKGLWERNSRFYFPSVHGTWDDFSQMSRVQGEMGVVGADNVWKNVPGGDKTPDTMVSKSSKMVWGPIRPAEEQDWFETEDDPVPPTTYDADKYTWGVGEEADYISLNPIFDPEGTTWLLKDDITGYNRTQPLPPRRAAIITTSRLSRRLLMKMHRMTAFKKQFAFPEMWPATVALQHGYKAVYAPHPMFVDRKWPVEYMAQTYNGGRGGSSGGSRTSIFGEREHNFKGLSWFYNSGFAPNLYKRWLGLKVNNDGGEDFEKSVDETKNGSGVGSMRGGEGRMCIPPMLLHPVKDVELPVEAPPEEDEKNVGSDPTV